MQIGDSSIPPILFMPSSVSTTRGGWRLVACQVLPDFTRTAATRSHPPRLSTPASATHSPCFQLHARPAGPITAPAGGLLPHPFSPYPSFNTWLCCFATTNFFIWLCCFATTACIREAGLLSVAVVVKRCDSACPHLLFREATWPLHTQKPGSREVPLHQRQAPLSQVQRRLEAVSIDLLSCSFV